MEKTVMNVSEKQGTGSMILPLNVERNKVKTLGEKNVNYCFGYNSTRSARGKGRGSLHHVTHDLC